MTTDPGVKVRRSDSIVTSTSLFKTVSYLKMPGLIFNVGLKICRSTTMLDCVNSEMNIKSNLNERSSEYDRGIDVKSYRIIR